MDGLLDIHVSIWGLRGVAICRFIIFRLILAIWLSGLLVCWLFFTELTYIVGIGIRSRLDKPHAPSTIQGDVYEV